MHTVSRPTDTRLACFSALILFCLRRAPTRGPYWSFALQQHHSAHAVFIEILFEPLISWWYHFGWLSEDSGCWYKRNYHGRCSNRTFTEHGQAWAHNSYRLPGERRPSSVFALPIASCDLQLDNEAVRVTVRLRLGLDLCSPHECRCGSTVDARDLHSFVCKKASDKTIRHHCLNDLVAHSFSAAGFPVVKEPKVLCWDVTVICLLADSYISAAALDARAAAELVPSRKEWNTRGLHGCYMFALIQIKSHLSHLFVSVASIARFHSAYR